MTRLRVWIIVLGVPSAVANYYSSVKAFGLMDKTLSSDVNAYLMIAGVAFGLAAGAVFYYTVEAGINLLRKD